MEYHLQPTQLPPQPFHTQEYHLQPTQLPPQPFHTQETEWEEEEDEEDDLLMFNSLEEALQDVNIQLPRLAVTAPPSVLPPKGGGRCRLPNLGNTCYLNAILQCLYHTPGFPALLTQACEELEVGQRGGTRMARALKFLMTKMDDVKRVKRGVLAYIKGVCGFRDEKFAGMEQQEAHDLLTGLLLWLHKDLASQEELDCACTKNSLTKRATTTTTTTTTRSSSDNDNGEAHSSPQGFNSLHHNQQQELQPSAYQYRPPVNRNYHPNYNVYTGSNNYHHQPQSYDSNFQQQAPVANDHYYRHNQTYHQQQYEEHHVRPTYNNHPHEGNSKNQQEYSNQNSKSLPQLDAGKEGNVCQRCGLTYQRRSFVSDMFEGILQSDIICPKAGIILNTNYERFTSLSIPVSGPADIALEEALQQHFAVSHLMWDCEYCKESHMCYHQSRVLYSPRVLLIHLSRNTERRAPRKQSVTFPTRGLTLEEHMKPTRKSRPPQYGLYAVCNHHGTRQQGHYNACCRANRCHTEPGTWYLFDDDEITRTTHFQQPREAHILCYSSPSVEAM